MVYKIIYKSSKLCLLCNEMTEDSIVSGPNLTSVLYDLIQRLGKKAGISEVE